MALIHFPSFGHLKNINEPVSWGSPQSQQYFLLFFTMFCSKLDMFCFIFGTYCPKFDFVITIFGMVTKVFFVSCTYWAVPTDLGASPNLLLIQSAYYLLTIKICRVRLFFIPLLHVSINNQRPCLINPRRDVGEHWGIFTCRITIQVDDSLMFASQTLKTR